MAEADAPAGHTELTALIARLRALESEVAALERALASSRRIGAAVGIVMATAKLTEAGAFDLLRIASQNGNRKLRDVADEVVTTGAVPVTAIQEEPRP